MASGLFSIARSALQAHHTTLQTISHNIANAETPGYSRQETELAANVPVRMTYGSVGTGVSVSNIARRRDALLDDSFRSANAGMSNASLRRDGLASLESVFGEPTDAGMTNALDQFWSSWSELSASPTSGAARAIVQQRGKQVASLLNSYDTQLTQQHGTALDRLSDTVARINQLGTQVGELNSRIVMAESGSGTASDLRDERDRMLDELSTLAGTRTHPQLNGGVTVIIGNSVLVDGTSVRPISLETVTPQPPPLVTPSQVPVRVRMGTSPDALSPLGGELAALVTFANDEIPAIRSRLDAIAASLASAVNTAHTAGFVFNGTTIPGTAAGNFFDAGTPANPVRAGTLRLDAAIAADASRIAVSGDPMAPTDNAAAKALAALRTSPGTVSFTDANGVVESGSFLGFFRTMVTRLGIEQRGADDDASVYGSLTERAEQRRQSASGVSTDEELVNMLRVQQSYAAATKLIKAADEMLQTLLTLV